MTKRRLLHSLVLVPARQRPSLRQALWSYLACPPRDSLRSRSRKSRRQSARHSSLKTPPESLLLRWRARRPISSRRFSTGPSPPPLCRWHLPFASCLALPDLRRADSSRRSLLRAALCRCRRASPFPLPFYLAPARGSLASLLTLLLRSFWRPLFLPSFIRHALLTSHCTGPRAALLRSGKYGLTVTSLVLTWRITRVSGASPRRTRPRRRVHTWRHALLHHRRCPTLRVSLQRRRRLTSGLVGPGQRRYRSRLFPLHDLLLRNVITLTPPPNRGTITGQTGCYRRRPRPRALAPLRPPQRLLHATTLTSLSCRRPGRH